jgi:hypothetical protein
MSSTIGYYGGIVTSGLVFYIDVVKRDSYTGIDTVWKSVARGNQLTGSLVNGVTYNQDSGSLQFDGVDDYSEFEINNLGIPAGSTGLSVCCWVYPNRYRDYDGILTFSDGISNPYGGWQLNVNAAYAFDFAVNINGVWKTWVNLGGSFTVLPTLNRWHYLVGTFDGTYITTYLNGVSYGSKLSAGSIQYTVNANRIRIGINKNTQGQYFQGSVSNAKVYNRALSAAEVLQNYNALKGRFGLS